MVADTLNKHLFTSMDCGATFAAHDLEFVPELVEFDKAHDKLFLVHDLEDTEKRLYVTKNFGETFSHVQVTSSCALVGITPADIQGDHDGSTLDVVELDLGDFRHFAHFLCLICPMRRTRMTSDM